VSGSGKAAMTIFNRWGNVVYQVDDYNPETYWDGKNQDGKDVPPDTYYYVLEEEGKAPRKGFVELRR